MGVLKFSIDIIVFIYSWCNIVLEQTNVRRGLVSSVTSIFFRHGKGQLKFSDEHAVYSPMIDYENELDTFVRSAHC